MRLLMWEPVSFSFESFFGDKGSALWEKKKPSATKLAFTS